VGFFLAAPLLADDLRLPDETVADLIGEAIHRTLETPGPLPPDELRNISDAFIAYLDQSLENSKEGDLSLKENTNE
jgi:hypothetical protein